MPLPAQETHKHFQVSGTDQAIAAVVPWPAHHQHGRLAGGEGAGWVGLVWGRKRRVMLGKWDTPPPGPPPASCTPTLAMAVAQLSPASSIS